MEMYVLWPLKKCNGMHPLRTVGAEIGFASRFVKVSTTALKRLFQDVPDQQQRQMMVTTRQLVAETNEHQLKWHSLCCAELLHIQSQAPGCLTPSKSSTSISLVI